MRPEPRPTPALPRPGLCGTVAFAEVDPRLATDADLAFVSSDPEEVKACGVAD